MPFQNGNQHGKHNNHRSYGHLTKEQADALKGLVPRAIDVWRKILEMEVKPKGMSVQADTAGKVLAKFVADQYEGTVKHDAGDGVAELFRDVADRITGKNGGRNGSGSGSSQGAA